MKNPFYFGNEVYDDDFCNRVKELDELQKDVLNDINVLLYAPRRFGKTSILKRLKTSLSNDDNIKVIFFDWFSISTIEEFIEKYFHTIAITFETTTDKVIKLFKEVLQIRPNINMSISSSNDISYGLSFNKKDINITLEEVINLPYIYAQKLNKKVIVIFDEFQEVEQFDIEKKLRTLIQTHTRYVSYVFCGSKKSIITNMFNDKNRAFYKSVKHNIIKEITLSDWLIFATNKFVSTNKSITENQIEKIYNITNGFPYYMQQLLYLVWEISDTAVIDSEIQEALKLMYEREYDLYAYIYSSLTPNQKKTLKYIVEYDGTNLYANDNLSSINMSASTLKSTLELLIKKDICDKSIDKYYLIDPFMKYWLNLQK